MDFIFMLIVWILCGWGCSSIAKKCDWNVPCAWILGILFSLGALVVYLIAMAIKKS